MESRQLFTLPLYSPVAGVLPKALLGSSGVIDVTNLPAGAGSANAVPNDGNDDTAAIQAAIRYALSDRSGYDRNNAPAFVYLPNGTYNISSELQTRVGTGGFSDGWRRSMYLIGESQSGTILKLANNQSGYQDKAHPLSVIKTGSEGDSNSNPSGGGNRAFDHTITNLTIDTGSGNPGAIGIDYVANNTGAIEDVTIKSSDSAHVGLTGISMLRNWPGPAEIKDVTIDGFDYGVQMDNYVYSMTIEHVTLQNQQVRGILQKNNSLFVRGLKSVNSVPVFESTVDGAHIVITDADFSGGISGNTAIITRGDALLRNITSTGYGTIVHNTATESDKTADVTGGASAITVGEWVSHSVRNLFSGSNSTLGLTVKETPEYYTSDTSKYLSVTDSRLTSRASPNDSSNDDAPGIQAAIDQAASLGADIVYLPNGVYNIGSTIVLRGGIKKIMGVKAYLVNNSGFTGPTIRMDGGTQDNIIVEFLTLGGVIQDNSSKGFVLRHVNFGNAASGGYENTSSGTGDVFFEDVSGGPYRFNYTQNMWARQLNPEFISPAITNRGANLWILGMKTEDPVQLIDSIGGSIELLGAYEEPNADAPAGRVFIKLQDTNFSGSFGIGGDKFATIVQDTHGTDTRNLKAAWVADSSVGPNDIKMNQFRNVPLFVSRATTRTTYGNSGNPWAVPATGSTRIQAENYDTGGQDVAYHDSTSGNTGGQYRSDDVDVETTSDNGGGYDVGYTASGEWLEYTINVATAGNYDFTYRTARGLSGTSSMSMSVDGTDKTGSLTVNPTGGWQTWQDTTKSNLALTAGVHVIRIYVGDAMNLNYFQISPTATVPTSLQNGSFESGLTGWTVGGTGAVATGGGEGVYSGSLAAIFNGGNAAVGSTLSQTVSLLANTTYSATFRYNAFGDTSAQAAVALDISGAVTAASVSDTQNGSGFGTPTTGDWVTKTLTFTTNSTGGNVTLTFTDSGATNSIDAVVDDVSLVVASNGAAIPGKIEAENYTTMSGIQTESTTDTGGGYDVGYTDAGDSMSYAVNVTTAGTYNIDFRVASVNSGTQFQLKSGSTVLATINVPNTGGWQTWQTVTASGIILPAGAQTLTVYASTGGWNLNWMNFASIGNTVLSRTGWSSSASNNSGNAGNAIDGNASTRWDTNSVQTNGQYFQLDLGASKTFNKLVLDSTGSSGDYPRGYAIYVSDDGVNWGSSITTGSGSSDVVNITFANQTKRYLRIVQTGTSGSNYWSIHELNLYV